MSYSNAILTVMTNTYAKEKRMYTVKTKKVEPIQVIAKKATVPNFEESGQLNIAMFSEVREHIQNHDDGFAGYDVAIYHRIPGQTELELEVAIPIHTTLPQLDGTTQYSLPQVEKMAYIIHFGDYTTIHLAHQAIQIWMNEHGYVPAGAVRDVYLVFDVNDDPKGYVTELQYPVQKIS